MPSKSKITMTIAAALNISEDRFKKLLGSAAHSANKDQRTLMERYKKEAAKRKE